MDELRGPTIQIVLHLKEGVGFGFLKTPFIVSGSLNGYTLETDPVVPCHAPVFDAELVWEADKRRFRNLRVQNVPVKMEVYTTGTQGRRDKVGYMLLSLLGAQPCPNNRVIDIKYVWHRLLGVKSEGKCCQPQLMLSLTIQDRTGTLTPRNELRMFHSSEPAASPRPAAAAAAAPAAAPARTMHLTVAEYLTESKKSVTSPDLEPRLLCDEGIIQIGAGADRFVLSLVVGALENVDMLLPSYDRYSKESNDCYIAYSVFTHNITTDRVSPSSPDGGPRLSLQLQQRSSLRLRTSLHCLHRYFAECPRLVLTLRTQEKDIGITSIDLRKLIPTTDLQHFTSHFCNTEASLTIHERCYMLSCDGGMPHVLPFVDVEMSLRCVTEVEDKRPPNLPLTARSVTQLETTRKREDMAADVTDLQYRSGSCTQLDAEAPGAAYTNITSSNTNRYRNAAGDAALQTNDIADMIKKMCDSFASSQEKLLSQRLRPTTSDVQVQCDHTGDGRTHDGDDDKRDTVIHETADTKAASPETANAAIQKEVVKQAIPVVDRDAIMQRFVNELEDWKEKQQELYKCQLIRKEEYHLELLSQEWRKRRDELETKLARGIEQCRNLAADLSRATEDFRLRGYRNTERERKLLEAKNGLEQHYTAKYQQLREASQSMEQDMNRQLRTKDQRIEDLELADMRAKKKFDALQNELKNLEKDADSKHSGLTKDQTANLIQELRCLEEKLDVAVQSKAFFKEQWGRCVRELHFLKLSSRRQMLTQLQQDRRDLGDNGLDPIPDLDEGPQPADEAEMSRLKDDYLVQLLADMPDSQTRGPSTTGPEGMNMCNDLREIPKNPANEKLNRLILRREELIKQESPDEEMLQQLNHDIRNILLNYGT